MSLIHIFNTITGQWRFSIHVCVQHRTWMWPGQRGRWSWDERGGRSGITARVRSRGHDKSQWESPHWTGDVIAPPLPVDEEKQHWTAKWYNRIRVNVSIYKTYQIIYWTKMMGRTTDDCGMFRSSVFLLLAILLI